MERILGQLSERDSADSARSSLEARIDHLVTHAEYLKLLGALIGGEGADTHLCHHLRQEVTDDSVR